MCWAWLQEQSKAKPQLPAEVSGAGMLPVLGGALCDGTPQQCRAALSTLVKDLQHA